jgi:hypothetical protein
MSHPLRPRFASLAWFSAVALPAFGQTDPLVDHVPAWSSSVRQSFSWSETAVPDWAHTTSLRVSREIDSDPAFLTDIHAGVDLLGAGFQFDSLWGVQPRGGVSATIAGIDATLDGWALYGEEEWSDGGASLDLTRELLEAGELRVAGIGFASASANSGSEAGLGLEFRSWSSSVSMDANLSISRLQDADLSSVTRLTGKRAITTDLVGDQWAFRFEPGAGMRIANGGIGFDIPMAALRSELTTVSMKKGSVTKAQWALDAAPSAHVYGAVGAMYLRATYGLQVTTVLGSKSEDSDPVGWATLSASYRF